MAKFRQLACTASDNALAMRVLLYNRSRYARALLIGQFHGFRSFCWFVCLSLDDDMAARVGVIIPSWNIAKGVRLPLARR